jgi:hypothetical protein
MKKGLVLALALLTVFAFVSCDDSDSGGKTEDKDFTPPADWKGLNEVTWEAKEYHNSGIADMVSTPAGAGAYNVTIKTRSTYSAVWFNYQAITLREGWYISLTLPDSPKPSNVIAYTINKYNGDGTADLAWPLSQDADTTGIKDIEGVKDAPGRDADGNVVNDLQLLLQRPDADVDYYGISLQFYWPETVTFGEDYTFKINMIKVKQHGPYVPPEPPIVNPYPEWESEITKKVDLGEFTWNNNDDQKGWKSNGMDTEVTDLAIEDLVNAEYLILELNAKPAGGFQIVWQGNGTPGWAWNQEAVLDGSGRPLEGMGAFVEETDSGAILGIKFSDAFAEKDYPGFKASTQAKILIAYYTGGIAGLGIQKAYLGLGWPIGYKEVNLGEMNVVNNVTQQGWATNGQDGVVTDLTTDILISAKYLVLELSKAPTGGMQIIWQGNGKSPSDWNQQDDILTGSGGATGYAAIIPGTGDAVTVRIDLSKAFKDRPTFELCTQAKFFVAYYSSNVADLGITKAYLSILE